MRASLYLIMIIDLVLIPCAVYSQTIHVFGDGHALHYFASEKLSGSYVYSYNENVSIPIEIHWLLSKTMKAFGHDTLDTFDIRYPLEWDIIGGKVVSKVGKPVCEGDILVMVLGEIDVRNYIGTERDNGHKEESSILEELVHGYMNTLQNNIQWYNALSCVIMEVTPPLDEKECIQTTEVYGTLSDRINLTRLLNRRLQQACKDNGYLFLPIHDLYVRSDGTLDPALSDRIIHVAFEHNYLIRKRLIELLIQHNMLSN